MTIYLFADNAQATLAAPVVPADTTVTLATGTGALFPSPGAGEVFTFTMQASDGSYNEITLCTSRTGDVLTLTRAQEGTTAQSFAFNDPCGNLLTAGTMRALTQTALLGTAAYLDASDSLGTISSTQVYAGDPNGHVAGNAAVAGVSAPSLVWDTTDGIYWVCTTTGTTTTAVWTAQTSAGATTYAGTSAGAANAQTVAPAVPVTLTAGLSLAFIAGYSNTGALTLNASGTGAKAVYRESIIGPIALTGGEVVAGNLVTVRYDGTQYQLTTEALGTAARANASAAGVVAAVTGSFTVGHSAVFADTAGTIQDGGIPGAAAAPTRISFANNGATLGPGSYNVDTSAAAGGAFTVLAPAVPTAGQALLFYDYLGQWGARTLTIDGNGNTITAVRSGVSDTTLVCNVAGAQTTIVWNANTSTWENS